MSTATAELPICTCFKDGLNQIVVMNPFCQYENAMHGKQALTTDCPEREMF